MRIVHSLPRPRRIPLWSQHGKRTRAGSMALVACLCVAAAMPTRAQQQQSATTLNFRDVELGQVVEVVQAVTGKIIIVDPRVRAQVNIVSSTPLPPDELYETFLSLLQVHGFMAVPSGPNVIKIIPDANLRQVPGNDLPNRINGNSDEVVTQVVPVRNINAAQLVATLRSLMPQNSHLAASQGGNSLIISDRASNVNRIIRIIQRLDQAGDEEIDVVRLENATAADIVRVTNTLFTGAAAQQGEVAGTSAKVVADDRTNSVLITGEKTRRLRLKTLITHLDTPLETGGDTKVRYLRYADAEALEAKLKGQVQTLAQSTGGTPPAGGAPAGGGGQSNVDRSVTIWSDPQNNALIITAPPKLMRELMSVIDKLDIRRPQVLVEAILVEVSELRAAELGINWAIDGSDASGNTVPLGTFNQTVGGSSIGSIIAAIGAIDDGDSADASTIAGALPSGLTLGGGRFKDTGVNFALLLRALRGDSHTNVLQTPSVVTLDNEEAEIKVAQEVPFITGQFTNSGGNNNGAVNPFQTIQREEVGTILKITPQISDASTVLLKIEQENSDLQAGTQGAVDLITNKRTISTNVMVEDGGVIVLGGLIRDTVLETENRVPILGSIPIIGELFKTRSGSKEKRNLMVFIQPTILRDGVDAAIETNAKYNVVRERQLARKKGRVNLLPGERQPLLPPIEELSKYADPTAGAAEPAPGTDTEQLEQAAPDRPAPPSQPSPGNDRPNVPPPQRPQELRPQAQ